MRHVVHLITGLEIGGAEMSLARLVERLDPARFTSTVVSLAPEGALAARIRAAGANVVSLGMGRNPAMLPVAVLQLRHLLKTLAPDILQTWLYHADFLGLLAGRLAGVRPIIWNLRCADMDLRHYAATTRWLVKALARLSGLPDAVIVNSEAGRAWHCNLGYQPSRWAVIPNGFDTDRFRASPDRRRVTRRLLGVGPDTPLIGTVSRFDPMKDPATFLRAASLLAARRNDVHFVMAGRSLDPANPALAADPALTMLGDRLHLLGERSDIPDLMAGFDLFTLTSQSEGFPNVLGEAMASGLPCIATDVGDVRLLLADTGQIVPRGDTGALAKAWEAMLAIDSVGRSATGARARARIEACFGLAKSVEAYQALYAECAA